MSKPPSLQDAIRPTLTKEAREDIEDLLNCFDEEGADDDGRLREGLRVLLNMYDATRPFVLKALPGARPPGTNPPTDITRHG